MEKGRGRLSFLENNWKSPQYNYFLFGGMSQQLQSMQLISPGPFQIVSINAPYRQLTARGLQWPKQDLIKYAVYIAFHLKLEAIHSETDFCSWSFFRKLSLFVQAKNPNQCRIFHKKMMNEHSSINSLVEHLKSSITKFEEWYTFYESSLYNMRTCMQREKEEIKKQHTRQNTTDKIGINVNYYPGKQHILEDGKKNQDLKPTDVGYEEEQDLAPKPSSFMPVQTTRPSFSPFALEEQGSAGDDMSFFNQKASIRPIQLVGMEQRWRDCHNHFTSYMGKLSFLMNSSLQDL